MKYILILITSIFISNLYSQEVGNIFTKGRSREYTINFIKKEQGKGRFSNGVPTIEKTINDTLIYIVKSTQYNFTLKLTFNKIIDGVNYCDFQQYIFECEERSIKNISYLVNYLKHYSFKEIEPNKYLSTYSWKTELTIDYSSKIDECLSFTLRNVNKSKKEYKSYYKSLSKVNYKEFPFPFNSNK